MSKLYLTFYGGADGATGANFMLEKDLRTTARRIAPALRFLLTAE